MPLQRIVFLWCALILSGELTGLVAQSLEGIVYIASVRGDAVSSHKKGKLQKGDTLSASRNTISTGVNAFAVIVLSNGLAVYCGEQSELTIATFSQQPFDANADSLAYETSQSELALELNQGNFALSHRIPRATSRVTLNTKYGTIESHSTACVITLQPGDAKLVIFEGSARVESKLRNPSDLIQSEQWMNLQAHATTRTSDAIQRIDATATYQFQPWLTMATNMRLRTHFITTHAGNIVGRTIIPQEHFSRQPINDFMVD